MKPEDIAAWVAKSRAEQGLPRYVEDAAALDKLLVMLYPTDAELTMRLPPKKQKQKIAATAAR
jgi:hypothetical protein